MVPFDPELFQNRAKKYVFTQKSIDFENKYRAQQEFMFENYVGHFIT